MNYYVLTLSIYLFVIIFVIFGIGRSLFKNGQAFLNDIFPHSIELAKSLNHLLITGFYLLNIGYSIFVMRNLPDILSMSDMANVLVQKVGFILLFLGVIHLLNVYVLFRMRKKSSHTFSAE